MGCELNGVQPGWWLVYRPWESWHAAFNFCRLCMCMYVIFFYSLTETVRQVKWNQLNLILVLKCPLESWATTHWIPPSASLSLCLSHATLFFFWFFWGGGGGGHEPAHELKIGSVWDAGIFMVHLLHSGWIVLNSEKNNFGNKGGMERQE